MKYVRMVAAIALGSASGALIVQSQLSKKPLPSKRIFYPYALSTVISPALSAPAVRNPVKPATRWVSAPGTTLSVMAP